MQVCLAQGQMMKRDQCSLPPRPRLGGSQPGPHFWPAVGGWSIAGEEWQGDWRRKMYEITVHPWSPLNFGCLLRRCGVSERALGT